MSNQHSVQDWNVEQVSAVNSSAQHTEQHDGLEIHPDRKEVITGTGLDDWLIDWTRIENDNHQW